MKKGDQLYVKIVYSSDTQKITAEVTWKSAQTKTGGQEICGEYKMEAKIYNKIRYDKYNA